MISTKKAKKIIRSSVKKISTEEIMVNDSLGRILSSNVKSTINSPPFNMSAMDGYAIKLTELNKSKKFSVKNEIIAGDKRDFSLKKMKR